MKERKHKNTELIAHSKNSKKSSPVIMVSGDGWVVTEEGAYGDNRADCLIEWENQTKFLKDLRKEKKLSQMEMAWVLGMNRTTYIYLEQGKRELTHKEWLITRIINENF